MKWHDAEGLSVIKRFVLKRGQYDLNVEYLIDNKSDEDWHGSLYAQIQRLKTGSDGGMFGMHTSRAQPFPVSKPPTRKSATSRCQRIT